MAALDRPALLAAAEAFHTDDPDPDTQAELRELLTRGDLALLAERFAGRLEFGTAGLRGFIGAGDSLINRRVVAQTTAGLCAYLATALPNAKTRGVCIGYDGRRKSREFAEEAASVVTGAGFIAYLFEEVASTPLLAFCVLDRGCAAGIMITASHNPAQYNGYKVYWHNGAQIIPPHDTLIEQAIGRVGPVLALPRLAAAEAREHGLLRTPDGVEERYHEAVRGLVGSESTPASLRIAYTALHGVGERFTRRALAEAGFPQVVSVAAQAEPDPEFPTVVFPNPEEKGAMDLVLALAQSSDADLVLANDPDADRLAAATRTRSGTLVQLTGNELGVLLADFVLAQAPRDGKNLVLSSLVSTPMVGRIAQAHGARWEHTLTGFKWIANRAIELQEKEGLRFLLGFEEALGYTAGTLVRDKDGVSTAALVARMAMHHHRAGRSLSDALEALYREHGLYVSRPISITLPGLEGMGKMKAVMDLLRETPLTAIAELPILVTTDLELGFETRGSQRRPATLPKNNALIYELEGAHRICIRPSGTEPKIKIYIDSSTQVAQGEPLAAAHARAAAIAETLRKAFTAQAGL